MEGSSKKKHGWESLKRIGSWDPRNMHGILVIFVGHSFIQLVISFQRGLCRKTNILSPQDLKWNSPYCFSLAEGLITVGSLMICKGFL